MLPLLRYLGLCICIHCGVNKDVSGIFKVNSGLVILFKWWEYGGIKWCKDVQSSGK